MSEFTNVTVVKKCNVFFDGLVTSRTILFADGSRKTLGVMQPGQFEFTTRAAELMEIMSGDLDALLPGESEWRHIPAGESFAVPADATFSVRVRSLADYCCSFLA